MKFLHLLASTLLPIAGLSYPPYSHKSQLVRLDTPAPQNWIPNASLRAAWPRVEGGDYYDNWNAEGWSKNAQEACNELKPHTASVVTWSGNNDDGVRMWWAFCFWKPIALDNLERDSEPEDGVQESIAITEKSNIGRWKAVLNY